MRTLLLLKETRSIKDYWYCKTETYTTSTTVDIPLPSSFELTFKVHRVQTTQNSAYLEIGGNTGNTAICGQIGGVGVSRVRLYSNEGSSQYTDMSVNDNPLDKDALYVWVKNGSDNTFSMNDSSVSFTNSLTHSKIRKVAVTNNTLKELKIKSLT